MLADAEGHGRRGEVMVADLLVSLLLVLWALSCAEEAVWLHLCLGRLLQAGRGAPGGPVELLWQLLSEWTKMVMTPC